MLDNLFEQFTTLKSPEENLKKLIEVYKVFNINISIIGKLPKNKEVGETFFEIIREAVTNAIIHANSKNIKVVITNSLEKTEMLITNDGIKPNNFIDWIMQLNFNMVAKATEIIEKQGKFDVIHAHDWLVANSAKTLKHAYGIPLVSTIHATESRKK